ncbi:restriction endonuclease subunit S, partial [Citrifermentans bremense]|uniref:restriction endonuclease subunit S n=1 Tax=Citrifermentans bremense TaxID=60035 RepID=UPI0004114E5B
MKWETYLIGELVDSGLADIQTGPFGTQLKASDYIHIGTPVINVRNIGYSDLRTEKLEYVGDQVTTRLSAHLLKENDIVFGRKGAVDRHLFVTKEQEKWMQGSDCIRLRFDTNKIISRFISYAFLLSGHQQWMLKQAGNKATMASLNQDIIKRIALRVPLRSVQTEIIKVLSGYDDLIQNNQRRIVLLEEAVRQVYQEWFVRLRFPGYEHTRIVDGVPEGWVRKSLREVAYINSENLPSSYDGAIEYIDIASVTPGQINETTGYAFRDAPSRARRIVKHGDIIWSCVRPNRRSHAVIWNPAENLIASTGFAVISPQHIPTSFLYQALTTEAFVGYLVNHAKGAAYPAVVAGDFERAEVLVPKDWLLAAFNEFAEPQISLAHNLRVQNQKLRAARDLLLPKLMSGEISV